MKAFNILAATFVLSLSALAAANADTLPVAKAVDSATTRSAQVSFADLDLSSVQGQQTAQERVHQTARRLCSQVADYNDLSHHENFVKCVAGVTERAQPALEALARKDSSSRAFASNQAN